MEAHEGVATTATVSPSPPRRRHKKHHEDPFLELSKKPDSPSSGQDEPQDPLLTRIILTPLYMTSFFLSLFLIDNAERKRRHNEHSTSTPSLLSYFSPAAWIDPEPYQDPNSSTWDRRDSSAHIEPHSTFSNAREQGKQGGQKRSWHLHKKIRKVVKLEIGDAFEMRSRVIVLIVSLLMFCIVGVVLGLRWVVSRMWWGTT